MRDYSKALAVTVLLLSSHFVAADPTCNKGMLNAFYGYQATGHAIMSSVKQELISDGTFRFKGTGTNKSVTFIDRPSTFGNPQVFQYSYTGEYAVLPNCTGTVTLTKKGATTLPSPIVITLVVIDGGNSFLFRMAGPQELWGGEAKKI